MIERLDHVAVAVPDLDEHVDLLTTRFGLRLRRTGVHRPTGARLALLDDPVSGLKLELVESDGEAGFLHFAFAVDDVAAEHGRLEAEGLDGSRGVARIDAAKADSAMLATTGGLELQLVRYDADSPDR